MALRRGIEEAVEAIIEVLRHAHGDRRRAQPPRVATLAANDRDRPGDASALARVGKEGIVDVEESASFGMEVHLRRRSVWDHGYISPYMATDIHRMETVFSRGPGTSCSTNEKISRVQDPMFRPGEGAPPAGAPLVVVAENIMDGPGMLVANNVHETFWSVVVRTPGFSHRRLAQLGDVAASLVARSSPVRRALNLEG